jgi:hypothetical protein
MLGPCLLRLSLPAHMPLAGAPMPLAALGHAPCAVCAFLDSDAPSLVTLALAAGRADLPSEAAPAPSPSRTWTGGSEPSAEPSQPTRVPELELGLGSSPGRLEAMLTLMSHDGAFRVPVALR